MEDGTRDAGAGGGECVDRRNPAGTAERQREGRRNWLDQMTHGGREDERGRRHGRQIARNVGKAELDR